MWINSDACLSNLSSLSVWSLGTAVVVKISGCDRNPKSSAWSATRNMSGHGILKPTPMISTACRTMAIRTTTLEVQPWQKVRHRQGGWTLLLKRRCFLREAISFQIRKQGSLGTRNWNALELRPAVCLGHVSHVCVVMPLQIDQCSSSIFIECKTHLPRLAAATPGQANSCITRWEG